MSQLPPFETALARAVADDSVVWSVQDYLLASIADSAAIANWQRQGDASKARPDPVTRPGGTVSRGMTKEDVDRLRAHATRRQEV